MQLNTIAEASTHNPMHVLQLCRTQPQHPNSKHQKED
jgi:hypothetical protein